MPSNFHFQEPFQHYHFKDLRSLQKPVTRVGRTDDGVPLYQTESAFEVLRHPFTDTLPTHRSSPAAPQPISHKVIKIPHRVVHTKIIEASEDTAKQTRQNRVKQKARVQQVCDRTEKLSASPASQQPQVITHIHEQAIYKEVEVPHYVPVPKTKQVEVPEVVPITHRLPKLYEAEIQYEVTCPKIRVRYEDVEIPLYLPRFCEFPMELYPHDREMHTKAIKEWNLADKDVRASSSGPTTDYITALFYKALHHGSHGSAGGSHSHQPQGQKNA